MSSLLFTVTYTLHVTLPRNLQYAKFLMQLHQEILLGLSIDVCLKVELHSPGGSISLAYTSFMTPKTF